VLCFRPSCAVSKIEIFCPESKSVWQHIMVRAHHDPCREFENLLGMADFRYMGPGKRRLVSARRLSWASSTWPQT